MSFLNYKIYKINKNVKYITKQLYNENKNDSITIIKKQMKNHLQNINHNITQRGEEGTGNDRESNFDKGASGAAA